MSANSALRLSGIVAIVSCGLLAAYGQQNTRATQSVDPASFPDEQAVEKARRAAPQINDANLAKQPVPRMPNIESPAVKPGVDVGALAKRYSEVRSDAKQKTAAGNNRRTLLIFVTLAMPRENLALLAADAKRIGATLLLRGLQDNSMGKTARAIRRVSGDSGGGWAIDPTAYARFGVSTVPAFVLAPDKVVTQQAQCTGTCLSLAEVAMVSGDVSVRYALETMKQRNPTTFGKDIEYWLGKLGG